jgi:hypothetical protein
MMQWSKHFITFRRPGGCKSDQAQEQKQDRSLETRHCLGVIMARVCVGLQRNVMELQHYSSFPRKACHFEVGAGSSRQDGWSSFDV